MWGRTMLFWVGLSIPFLALTLFVSHNRYEKTYDEIAVFLLASAVVYFWYLLHQSGVKK